MGVLLFGSTRALHSIEGRDKNCGARFAIILKRDREVYAYFGDVKQKNRNRRTEEQKKRNVDVANEIFNLASACADDSPSVLDCYRGVGK
jgi:hypothetical protein